MSIKLHESPRIPAPATTTQGLLPADAARGRGRPFFLAHHPDSYEFVEKAGKDRPFGFIPRIDEQRAVAGANGVSETFDANGRVTGVDDSLLRAHLMRKGTRIINPDDAALGPWQYCCRANDCVGGGKAYVFNAGNLGGVRFEPLPNGRSKIVSDPEAWLRFRAYLRDQRLVHPLTIYGFNAMIDHEEYELRRLREKNNVALAAQIKAKEARIAAMHTEWNRINGDGGEA